MSDLERVAAALQEADAELEVQPPDLAQTVDHARRSLVRRLLVVGALSAIGATLLIVGGTAPALKTIRAPTAKNDQNPDKNGHGGHGGGGSKNRNDGNGGDQPHHDGGGGDGGKGEPLKAAVAPSEPIATELPNLVIAYVSKTEVAVENRSAVSSKEFEVVVTLETEGQTPHKVLVPFEEGLAGESKTAHEFELECESGLISAEVDPEDRVEESLEDDNASSESVKCEPAKEAEEEKAEAKETTGTIDPAVSGTAAGTAPP